MKTINYLNYFFVGLPLFFCFIALYNTGFLSYAMLSLFLTGIFQITIGLKMIAEDPHDKNLQIYAISVILFFISLIIICKMELYAFLSYFLFGISSLIAIFLSIIIIYKKAHK